jgi:hypothetical protein
VLSLLVAIARIRLNNDFYFEVRRAFFKPAASRA